LPWSGGHDIRIVMAMRMSFRRALLLLLALCVVSVGGCAKLQVFTSPPGAKIFVNGNDTGLVTPQVFKPDDLARYGGRAPYKIEADHPGYVRSPAQFVSRQVSVAQIFWSIVFPPLLLINVPRGFRRMTPKVIKFALQKHK